MSWNQGIDPQVTTLYFKSDLQGFHLQEYTLLIVLPWSESSKAVKFHPDNTLIVSKIPYGLIQYPIDYVHGIENGQFTKNASHDSEGI